ncbi:MAG: FAD-dependent oxidoreductase [Proteobacteria bacterium]|nr:FAD-dependent oxidoreductase [Pseudomonadota bacterium]MBU4471826.1 FAD-dependent oxidoreductase [Pseudomonadota bacterium]MCG2750606.1 FAD-dependent oxidoreductase [Desulfobacteraceae bacterium]
MSTENKKVTVIGGGIAGLTAAWELSRFGVNVDLVEKACFLGGHAIGFCCKATDACVQCGACSVEDMLKKVVDEPAIKIHLSTEIESITKKKAFEIVVKKSNPSSEKAVNGVLTGYSKNNHPLNVIVDKDKAGNAPKGAVYAGDLGTSGVLEADAVVLATGFLPFNADNKKTYGYGKFKNVITGLDLESIKRDHGGVVRPSDGQKPEKIAFIQCVGSRDERLGNLWCSKVCCPYALRMAEDVKFKNEAASISIFYMDIQNTGRNFPSFYEKCKSRMDFVRTIPVDVFPMEDDSLKMRYLNEETGLPAEDIFDLIVLSVGITPGADNKTLAEQFHVGINPDGFLAASDPLNRSKTESEGVFIAGTVEGPKTIADSMSHAGQAAGEAMRYLGVSK